MRDEHDLEVLRRRLADAERKATVAEVAAALAHELKNPLAPIQGYAQMLRGRLGDVHESERARFDEGLSIIEGEARRMDSLLRTFLEDAHRAFDGRTVDEAFALAGVARDAVRLIRGRPGDVAIECVGLDALGTVQGDSDSIRSALVNVLDNAIDAVSGGGATTGRIEVRGRREGTWQVVEVVDNGPGFGRDPSRYLRPFVTSKEQGTGMGLALVLAALEAAGGELELADDESGLGGASVSLRLPTIVE